MPARPWTVKPQLPVRLNRRHPLVADLVWYALPDAGHQTELVRGGTATLLTSGAWTGRTALGPALESTSNTNGGAYWPWSSALLRITTQHTMIMWLRPTGIADDGKLLCIPYSGSGWSNPFTALSLTRPSVGTALSIEMASGGTRFAVSGSSGAIDTTDPLSMYAHTRNGTTVRFYRNGTQHGTDATLGTAGAVDWTNTQPVHMMQRSQASNGEGMGGFALQGMIFCRALTAAEMRSLYADPWQLLEQRRFVRVESVGGGGTQSVTPGHLASTTTLHSPTVTPGVVTVTPGHISSTTSLHSPTVTPGAVTVTPGAIASTTTLHAPTISTGAVTVTPDHIGSTTTLHAPVVSAGGSTVVPDHISSTTTLHSPTITPGGVTVSPDHIASTVTLHSPSVTPGSVSVTPDAISSTVSLYAPTLNLGIFPDTIVSTAVLHGPTVTPGAVTVTPGHIASTATLYAPTVTGGVQVTFDYPLSVALNGPRRVVLTGGRRVDLG